MYIQNTITKTLELATLAIQWNVPITIAEERITSNIRSIADCHCASEEVKFGFIADASNECELQLSIDFSSSEK